MPSKIAKAEKLRESRTGGMNLKLRHNSSDLLWGTRGVVRRRGGGTSGFFRKNAGKRSCGMDGKMSGPCCISASSPEISMF